MREITDTTREVDQALLDVPEIKEALSLAEEAAYSPAELDAYEGYWKQVRSEKTMQEESLLKGKAEGRAEGRAEEKIETAKKMKAQGLSNELIAACTGLAVDEIVKL